MQVPCHLVGWSASSAGNRRHIIVLGLYPESMGAFQHLHSYGLTIGRSDLDLTSRQSHPFSPISPNSRRSAVTEERLSHSVGIAWSYGNFHPEPRATLLHLSWP